DARRYYISTPAKIEHVRPSPKRKPPYGLAGLRPGARSVAVDVLRQVRRDEARSLIGPRRRRHRPGYYATSPLGPGVIARFWRYELAFGFTTDLLDTNDYFNRQKHGQSNEHFDPRIHFAPDH